MTSSLTSLDLDFEMIARYSNLCQVAIRFAVTCDSDTEELYAYLNARWAARLALAKLNLARPERPDVGDFITIPAWNITGCVMAVLAADFGSDEAFTVLLQESPDAPTTRAYRLEPHEYVIL